MAPIEDDAGSAGESGMGGAGPDGTRGSGGHAEIPERCYADSDCDDGKYCNGVEYCKTLSADSEIKVCMGPEHGPCYPSQCTEETKCDCANGDQDGDGFNVEGCADSNVFDCDDNDFDRHPGLGERCDDHDEDCRDDTVGTEDLDHDGFTSNSCTNKAYYQPLLFSPKQPLMTTGPDCNDGDAFTHPGAAEVCDNRDNNCNGKTDEVSGAPGDPHTYYRDEDGDYWGSDAVTDKNPLDTLCNFPPPGYSALKGDCDDHNPRISPAREEICDGADNDCNGTIDQPDKPGDLLFGQPYDGVTVFECDGARGWKVKTCPPARLDCDDSYLDACETLATTTCNCHGCGNTCAFSCGDTDCEEIRELRTGDTHTCAIVAPKGADIATIGGKIACWGRNDVGQLGNGTKKDSATPGLVGELTGATALALGERHSCAITSDSRILCWGDSAFGQLGAGIHGTQSVYPLAALIGNLGKPEDVGKPKAIASGRRHVCAIFGEGTLACWGSNSNGQLGTGYEGNDLSNDAPLRVLREADGNYIANAQQVVAGEAHTCILAAGKVECWGDNEVGELGEDPDEVPSKTRAHLVPGLAGLVIEEIAASGAHTCARAGSEVRCWGSNLFGELASDDEIFGKPTKIALPPDVTSLTTGRFFGCAVSKGIAQCWGSNEEGQLGKPADTLRAGPTEIALPNIQRIFGGDGRHICALTRNSVAWCWGRNDFGQLGNGQVLDRQPTPTRVSALGSSLSCVP